MQTIKFLKPDSTGKQKIQLNGITYKPYTICDLPANFGFNYDEENGKEGIGEWFNYKGYTYILDSVAKMK